MRVRAIAGRIINQLRHDKRTMALVLAAPLIVLTLVYFVFQSNGQTFTVSVINAPKDMISEIRSNDDYDITIRRDNKKAAVGAVKNGDAEAAFSADKDCRRVKIYLDGSNASDAKIIRAVIEQSAAKVVRDNAENAVSDLKKTMADNPAAPDIDIEMAEPDITAKYIYGTEDGSFLDSYGAPLIGAIIFFFVFLIAGINFLNERKGGTLERILSTPAKRSEIIAGYVLGFGALAVVQTIVLTLFVVYVLGMTMEGSIAAVLLINILTAVAALTLGMLLSTLASSEFQMMQFIPLVILPQIFLCGLFRLSGGWDVAGHFMPLYYTADALTAVMVKGLGYSDIAFDAAVLAGCAVLFMALNAGFLKRQRTI
jgi:ABC-type multidrug transport system, permease component